jgi:hypothetical protein
MIYGTNRRFKGNRHGTSDAARKNAVLNAVLISNLVRHQYANYLIQLASPDGFEPSTL